jgi:hypothetical protein
MHEVAGRLVVWEGVAKLLLDRYRATVRPVE